MINVQKRRIDRLNEELSKLQNELCKDITELKDIDELVKQINSLEAEIKENKQKALLKKSNEEHAKNRELITKLFNIEFPFEDITTNDSYFHATKLKKHKGLKEILKDSYSASAEVITNEDKVYYTTINIGGNRIKTAQHNYKENAYNYFETLEEMLYHNGVKAEPVTWSHFKKTQKASIKAAEKLKKAMKKYDEEMKSVESYFFECNGMLRRDEEHGLYTYS